jgi:hypothetical protein
MNEGIAGDRCSPGVPVACDPQNFLALVMMTSFATSPPRGLDRAALMAATPGLKNLREV